MASSAFMASASSSSLLFLITYLILLPSPSFSSSSSSSSSSKSSHIVLPLSHSLSSTTAATTTHHLLKSSARSAARFLHHRQRHRQHHHNNRQISLPLSPGTDYTLSLSLGSHPSQPISLYMDTGSDLVWFPSTPFECILCEGKPIPAATSPPNISASASPVPCDSPSCSAVHSSLPTSDLCAISRCPLESIELSECSSFSCPPFYYAYADGSFIARLYRDTFIVPASPPLHFHNFTFGAAHTALAEPLGVAGFGRGLLSLPAQLSTNRFSYCLISHSFDARRIRRPSPLILGRYSPEKQESDDEEAEFVYTPMLDNPKHPYFYSVGLEAVSVGRKRIPAPESLKRISKEGNGGMVVDSGTTFTMLPAGLYETVVAEFDRRVGRVYKRASEIEEKTGLKPCYFVNDAESDSVVEHVAGIPGVVLHFVGNASVVLPRRNFFFRYVDGGDDKRETENKKKKMVGCLMVMNGGDEAESGGPAATLGNYQQQGFEVAYDLEEKKVGFARKQCASLWDRLNGH